MLLFFCKQNTAYEMRISDWSSDVCSSDLHRHAILLQIGACSIGEHDARPVVVREDERAFDRARRDDDLLRPHLPKPFAWLAGGRHGEVIGQLLGKADPVMWIIAERDRKSTRLKSSH